MPAYIRVIVITAAFLLFAIAAYVATDLGTKLTRAGLALVVLAWLLP